MTGPSTGPKNGEKVYTPIGLHSEVRAVLGSICWDIHCNFLGMEHVADASGSHTQKR